MKRFLTLFGAISTLLGLPGVATIPALAEEPLPGVKQPKPIVAPEPEPLAHQSPASEDGWVTVGNTRVKVSGSITVDIGAGNTKPPRK